MKKRGWLILGGTAGFILAGTVLFQFSTKGRLESVFCAAGLSIASPFSLWSRLQVQVVSSWILIFLSGCLLGIGFFRSGDGPKYPRFIAMGLIVLASIG